MDEADGRVSAADLERKLTLRFLIGGRTKPDSYEIAWWLQERCVVRPAMSAVKGTDWSETVMMKVGI